MMATMRFRSLFSLPTGSGYLGGFTFTKGAAYGLASDLGGDMDRERRNRQQLFAVGIKRAMIEMGIAPMTGETKAQQIARRNANYRKLGITVPAEPAVPADPTVAPREVLPPHSVVASQRQHQPAAVSSNGGVRGSNATRWRR